MKITVAKTAGFCFGVRNAIKIAQEESKKSDQIVYTYGPLIHNNDVIRQLESQGVYALEVDDHNPDGKAPAEVDFAPGSKVVIRAHGVGEAVYESLKAKGAELVDATCPYVKKIHSIVRKQSEQGKSIIILGDPKHPEVQGIRGWCLGEPLIYRNEEEILENPPSKDEEYTLVAQTTFDQYKFKKILELFEKMEYNLYMCPTICKATAQHQTEALELAKQSDMMIVIGGKHSSNTRKLYNLCSSQCPLTYFVENAKELSSINFNSDALTVGVTAGASTPDYIIQEVVNKMSENNVFEAMLNESFKEIHSRDIVTGTVVQVAENEIVFNIGYKCDGTMSKAEFGGSDAPLTEQVKEGDTIEVMVVKVGDSEVTLSRRRLVQDRAYMELEQALENKTVLTGTVAEALENGIIVMHGESKVFIPSALADIRRVDLKTLVGQEVEYRIIRLQRKRGRIMGDRRSVMAEQRAALRAETVEKLAEGARLTGTVKNITNYCAFIDLGGIDGMLHISEMGWSAVRNPNRYVKEGEQIEVMVKSYDAETGRISLSTKFPETNPWKDAAEKFAIGNIVTGTVVRFADFGAFVELSKGVDALVHISHLSRKFVKHPSEVLTIGQEVEAKVIDFNEEAKRISLSMRELEPEVAPEAEEVEATEE